MKFSNLSKWICLPLLSMIFLNSISGCVEPKEKIIYSGINKMPDEAFGALRIATNNKIPVVVVGATEYSSTVDIGGYFAVHPNDLKTFLDAVKKVKEHGL